MNPNDVHELISSIIQEHSIPITAHNGKILLIVEGEYPGTVSERYSELKQCLETIIHQWKGDRILEDYKNRMFDGTWYATITESFSEIHNKVECVASDSSCVSEAKEVLQSLIEEQALPIKTIQNRIKVVILPDNPIDYRTEEMIELEDLLQKMSLDGSIKENVENIYVRHSGFSFGRKKGTPDIDFSKIQEITNYLQSEIVEHGLHVKLIHKGFALKTDNEIDLDRTETEEILYRLTIMTGINFRVSGSGVNTTYLGADGAYPYSY
ncbi:MAG: hypothetical protein OXI43_19575 [Candidatus Poribacteria bacterium]|nr:hypothetical protein [Candidatus Poribacteria bacterium]